MTNKLDLRIPEYQPAPKAPASRTEFFLSLMILAGVCAILTVLLFQSDQAMSGKMSAKKKYSYYR